MKIVDILNIKNNIMQKHDNNNNTLSDLFLKIHDASRFNIDDIGLVLEQLISQIENESYSYYKAKYTRICKFYEEGYGYDSNAFLYDAYLINKTEKLKKEYKEEYISEMGPMLFKKDDNLIVLSISSLPDENVCFYDKYANKNKKIEVKNYDYIYDFIDYVIEYKIENEMQCLDKNQLLELLENYLKNNIYGVSKSKKQKR